VTVAEQVDHIIRPRGDHALQRDPDNFQSLCATHHGQKSNWERANERNGTNKPLIIGHDADGFAIDHTGGRFDPWEARGDHPAREYKHHKP